MDLHSTSSYTFLSVKNQILLDLFVCVFEIKTSTKI